jgi:hypothetical protein
MAASMHGRLHTTTAAITITEAHTQLPHHTCSEPLLRVGPGRPRIRAAKRLYKILLVPGFHATCLASSADPEPLSNKLSPFTPRRGLNGAEAKGHWGPRPSNAFGQNTSYPKPWKMHSEW